MNCKHCASICRKAGKQKNGAQKYRCKGCQKYQQSDYSYNACKYDLQEWVCKLVCNGVGLRGIARIMKMLVNTAIKAILITARQIIKPPVPLNRTSFEMDEVRTYIGNKEIITGWRLRWAAKRRRLLISLLASAVTHITDSSEYAYIIGSKEN